MTDISVIILAGREARHIGRCLEGLVPLEARQILVVESQRGDRTHEIAEAHGATCVWHDWPGIQCVQFNWALDNLPIEGEWVLRIDADEYLTNESMAWLRTNLSDKSVQPNVSALEFTLERKFCGGEIRHGTNGIKMVRMFRKGRGRYAQTVMDERIVYDGELMPTPVMFYDDSLMPMDEWREKHRGYARREAEMVIAGNVNPSKKGYYNVPPYLRAFIYFCIRYFLKGGILDGYAGWMWNFWQGLWYRCLVDYEIGKISKLKAARS